MSDINSDFSSGSDDEDYTINGEYKRVHTSTDIKENLGSKKRLLKEYVKKNSNVNTIFSNIEKKISMGHD